jgi:hypothetical protein
MPCPCGRRPSTAGVTPRGHGGVAWHDRVVTDHRGCNVIGTGLAVSLAPIALKDTGVIRCRLKANASDGVWLTGWAWAPAT